MTSVVDQGTPRSPEGETRFEVQWADADPAGWIHSAAVLRYFEAAETDLFRRAGVTFTGVLERGWGMPRVHLEVDYRRPLRTHDAGTARARVRRMGRSSITLDFELVQDGETEPSVTGSLTMVIVDLAAARAIPVPDEIRRGLAC